MPNYDTQNGTDTAGAMENAVRNLKGYEWNQDDLDNYFNQVEIKMQSVGVKKQFTKLQVLSTILPAKVTDRVKPILRKKESEFTDNDSYLKLKTEILRIFGPRPNTRFERAMSRTLTESPSQLGNQLIDDLCDHELESCCCHRIVYGMWLRQLPSGTKQAISNLEFNCDTFKEVFETADNAYLSTRPTQLPSASVAAVQFQDLPDQLEQAFHQGWGSSAEEVREALQNPILAALGYGRGRGQVRGQRGQGRGQRSRGRGGQGRGGGRGNNQNQNSTPGQGNQGSGQSRHKTPRHSDQPPIQSCFRHWTYGKSAHFCQEPATCPWKDIWIPKSNNQ